MIKNISKVSKTTTTMALTLDEKIEMLTQGAFNQYDREIRMNKVLKSPIIQKKLRQLYGEMNKLKRDSEFHINDFMKVVFYEYVDDLVWQIMALKYEYENENLYNNELKNIPYKIVNVYEIDWNSLKY